MSEEEKKAIEKFKRKIERADKDILKFSDVYTTLDIHNLRLLLNLITKQQKELENNKKFKKDIVRLIMLWDEDEEDLPENDRVIECLDTIMSEVSRLEDIEDRKIQVAVEFVEEKRDKYWEKKIKEKIKELEDYMILFTNDKEKFNRYKYARNILEKLLKENSND